MHGGEFSKKCLASNLELMKQARDIMNGPFADSVKMKIVATNFHA